MGSYEAEMAHLGCGRGGIDGVTDSGLWEGGPFHTPPPPHGSTFFTTDLGGTCKMRWERHTEVQTYTFVRSATDDEIAKPFADSSVALGVIPRGWVAALPGLVLASVHVAMLPNAPSDFAALAQHFHRHDGEASGDLLQRFDPACDYHAVQAHPRRGGFGCPK